MQRFVEMASVWEFELFHSPNLATQRRSQKALVSLTVVLPQIMNVNFRHLSPIRHSFLPSLSQPSLTSLSRRISELDQQNIRTNDTCRININLGF